MHWAAVRDADGSAAWANAIQSLRATRFTPAFGRAVRVCDPALYGTAEAVPLSETWQRET